MGYCRGEKFINITKTYYKGADGFIFNFDIRDKNTLKKMDYYINGVKEERYNDYDSIICANCCDLEVQREITKEELKNYEQKYNIKIFETSAKSGLNVNRAFNYLIYQILKRKSNIQVLTSFEKWSIIHIDKFKISILKEPKTKNIFKDQYYYNINGKNVQLNAIYNNSYLDGDGLIFYFDVRYKFSFEYIINKINTIDDYYLNRKRAIIIYQAIKDKEDILIKKELNNLCNKNEIKIFKVYEETDIYETLKKLVIKIYDVLERNKTEINNKLNNKLNKYINF